MLIQPPKLLIEILTIMSEPEISFKESVPVNQSCASLETIVGNYPTNSEPGGKSFLQKVRSEAYNVYGRVGAFALSALTAGVFYGSSLFPRTANAQPPYINEFNQIANIEQFLDVCPKNDPAYEEIKKDFKIRHNGVFFDPDTVFCSEPYSQMASADITQELWLLQALRTLYYMDFGQGGHLPWTEFSSYDWMNSIVKGFNIMDGIPPQYSALCCSSFDDGVYVDLNSSQYDYMKDYVRDWKGISGLISLYSHEVRHADPVFPSHEHILCGSMVGDSDFDINDLSTCGVQWWLHYSWLLGDVNVGAGCLDSEKVNELVLQQLYGLDSYSGLFCYTKPPVIDTAPPNALGYCVGGSVLGSVTDGFSGLEDVVVSVFDAQNDKRVFGSAVSNADGSFKLPRLVGDYKILFTGEECFVPEWYDDKESFGNAGVVSVMDGQTLPISAELEKKLKLEPTPIVNGPASGTRGTEYAYQLSRSSQETTPLEYLVDWGDGTNTGWQDQRNITKAWQESGTYDVFTKYRCKKHLVESDWSAPIQVQMVNPNGPDLTASWNSLTQTCSNSGEGLNCKLKGSVAVQNTGNQSSTKPTTLALYLSEDNSFSQDDIFLKQYNVSALSPGAIKNLNTSANLPDGSTANNKYIIALITTSDVDQYDNTIAYGPVQGPDLIPAWTSLTQICKDTSKGIRCTLKGQMTVKNNTANTTSMTPTTLEVYLSQDNNLSDTQLKHYNVSALKPGYMKTINFSYTLPYGMTAKDQFLIATVSTTLDSNQENNDTAFGPVP
jgi:hypothetical protein